MRALVIEDSRPVRGIIAKIMRDLNFETREFANGQEALTSLQRDRDYDVATVNWQMPVMDGLEFVNAVRGDSRLRDLPLLMISSESDARQVKIAMQAGVNQYLVKPCTAATVAAKLKAMGLLKETGTAVPQSTGKTAPRSAQAVANAGSSKARVLIIDDSSIVRRVIAKTLDAAGDIETVGAAKDGIEGLEMIARLKPDVVLLDVDMPRMDGLETLREIRDRRIQVPVLMFSSRTERGAKVATDALLLGAKDFVFKPGGAGMSNLEEGKRAIEDGIIPRIRMLQHQRERSQRRSSEKTTKAAPRVPSRADLVVIGASTGGPAALASIIEDETLRLNLHAPIVIAQHMPQYFTKHLADRLAQDSGLDVAEVGEGETISAGMIRIAQGGRHTIVSAHHGHFVTVLRDDAPVNSCRPSVDVLFHSAASAASKHVLAVMLTGMGRDGKEGCHAIRQAGGWIVAQDEASSVVWGMPGSVIGAGLADMVMPLEKMGCQIGNHLRIGRTDGSS